jgi:hypothetical protein
MCVKGEHQVNHACQNNEPSDRNADRYSCDKRRADREHAKDDQQNAPQN